MGELREKDIVSKELESTKHSKKGLKHINHHKVLKKIEIFNEIERIKSEKDSTDTEAIQKKYTSKTVTGRFKRDLETGLDN